MGYYTYFTLSMEGPEDKIKEVENSDFDNNEYIKELVKNGNLEAKWYDFETEFPAFAKRFPDVLFCVYGDGEESGDVWEYRFKGVNDEYHQVEMPPFTALLTNAELKQRMKHFKE